jgi:hypothetical protein
MSISASRTHLIAVAALLIAPVAGSAQTPAGGPRFAPSFAALDVGRAVKVERPTGTTLGRYAGLAADTLALTSDDGARVAIALTDVTAAWRRDARTGRGALIGGIAGLAAGGIAGVVLASMNCSGSTNCGASEWVGIPALSALGGAALMAGIGALVGTAVHTWTPLAP